MFDFLEGLGKFIGVILLVIGFFFTVIGILSFLGSDPNPSVLVIGVISLVVGGILTGTSD